MGRRWRSRGKRGVGSKKIIFFSIIILMFFGLQSFIYVEKNLKAPLMNIAKVRVKQLATESINQGINTLFAQGADFDKLIDWKTDKDGKITGFMLNYAEHMKITSETISTMQNIMTHLQSSIEPIPLGMALNSSILASFGPNIPIRFVPAADVKVDLNTRSQNAGINMVLVEVYIRVVAEVTIIIPFESDTDTIENEIPISYVLVVGDTPMYYVDGKGNPLGNSGPLPPNISLPDAQTNSSIGGISGQSSAGGSKVQPKALGNAAAPGIRGNNTI